MRGYFGVWFLVLFLCCGWSSAVAQTSASPTPSNDSVESSRGLDQVKARLLSRSLLSEDDIVDLLQLNLAAKQGYPLGEELVLPQPWVSLLTVAHVRVQLCLLMENYQGLLDECDRGPWVLKYAEELEKVEPPSDPSQSVLPWVREDNLMRDALRVFAQRKLRILDPRDLERLRDNYNFTESPENRAELTLLLARTHLDAGDSMAFERTLSELRAYIEQPNAVPSLIIAYHCLSRFSTVRPVSLEACTDTVLRHARFYKMGVDPIADVFWISAGDELLDLVQHLMSSHLQASEGAEKERLYAQLIALNSLAHGWFKAATGGDAHLFDFGGDVTGDPKRLEVQQGRFALFLTAEKLTSYIARYQTSIDRAAVARERIVDYGKWRKALQGYWLEADPRFFPTKGDLWLGSGLHRQELSMKVLLKKFSPSEVSSGPLLEEILQVSPQEEALELALSWTVQPPSDEPEIAEKLFSRSQALAEKYRFPGYALLLAERQVQWLDASGRREEAIRTAQAAITRAGQTAAVAPTTPVPGGRSLAELVRELSEFVTVHRLQSGQVESALEQLEQGQAVRSAYQLSQGAGDSDGQAGQALRQIRQLKTEEDRLARGEALGSKALTTSVKGEFLTRSRELQTKFPELYDRALSIKPVELPRLQKHLPEGAVMLVYFPTDTSLYLFAVTNKTLVFREVPVSKSELDGAVLTYLRGLRRVDKSEALNEASRKLYAWLVDPVKEQLEAHATLLLVPTGRLNYLPFSALLDAQGRPLGETHKMTTLGKSSDFLDTVSQPSEGKPSVLVLADPAGDLPAARQEGEALASLFPGGVKLLRQQATLEALRSKAGEHPYLHLATHGEIDPADPGQNYLLMAQGEKLKASDIFSLPLENVSLVTLSACNTALGAGEPTASVVSLAENFWVTGPRTVVATLWAVNDASTSVFMQEFYQALKAGESKAEALQLAQTKLRNSEEFQHPYYWSPFILLGDWR